MANDIFSKVNLDNFSSLDLSRTTNMALSVQAEIEENNKLMKQAADEAYNNRQKNAKSELSKQQLIPQKPIFNYTKL